MLHWNGRADWMEFPSLSVNAGLTKTYTLAYKVTDDAGEHWTERFIRFKDKDRKAYYGAARLFYAAFPPLLGSLGLASQDCTFVAALSSSETLADPTRQIPYIADQLAQTLGAHSSLGSISKQPHQKIHTMGNASNRQAELAKAQYQSAKLPARNVFIFDDFVTRGNTFSAIAQAVLATNPNSNIYGVALAKTERTAWCPNDKNDQVPKKWDDIWAAGEKEVA